MECAGLVAAWLAGSWALPGRAQRGGCGDRLSVDLPVGGQTRRWAANAALLPSLPLDHGSLWPLLKCRSLRGCKHHLGNELLNYCWLEVCMEHVLLILAVTTGGSWAGDPAGAAAGLS